MDFGCFVPNEDTAAVLYSPYHSATACTDVSEGKSYALTEFIKRCITKNIMVYIKMPEIHSKQSRSVSKGVASVGEDNSRV